MNILGLSSPKVLPDLWRREVHPTPWASKGSSAWAEETCDSFLDSIETVRGGRGRTAEGPHAGVWAEWLCVAAEEGLRKGEEGDSPSYQGGS